jgi:hypothetical protein
LPHPFRSPWRTKGVGRNSDGSRGLQAPETAREYPDLQARKQTLRIASAANQSHPTRRGRNAYRSAPRPLSPTHKKWVPQVPRIRGPGIARTSGSSFFIFHRCGWDRTRRVG